jgi:MYXO-CTERM domain-containing protein
MKVTNILAVAGVLSASVAGADIIEVSVTGAGDGTQWNAWSVEMGAYVTEGGNEANWLGGIGYNSFYTTHYDFNGSGSLDYDGHEAVVDNATGTIQLDLGAGEYDVMAYDSYGDGWVAYNGDPHLNVTNLTTGEVIVDHHVNGAGANSEHAGSFTVLPAPGALALLGLAGIAGRRRRRA